jgi:DNA transposition AAA+ family ATPase
MRSKTVPVSNIARLSEAANALINRAYGMPGMGLIEGQTGYGKTTAVAWLSIKLNGAYVRALATTTPSSLLGSICKELNIGRRPTNVDTVEVIVQRLAETGRPLFIDEADYLVNKRSLIETLRDIHDLATVPVVLIGMHGFRRKVTHLQQLTGRIAQWVEFEPAGIDDAKLLARELAEVDVGPDLVGKLHSAANGSVRLIVVGLNRIEQYARNRSLHKIGAADWPANADFFVGTAPTAKRATTLAAVG